MASQGDTQGGRSINVRWTKDDQDLIVEWLEKRNNKIELVNLDSYQTGNHAQAAGKMLLDSGLSSKEGVTAQKASDKIKAMIKAYKHLRALAERTGWGVNPEEHEEKAFDHGTSTIRQHLISKCKWYYQFERILHKHPNITSPYLKESGQPDRDNGTVVNNDMDGDKDGRSGKDEKKETDEETDGGEEVEKVVKLTKIRKLPGELDDLGAMSDSTEEVSQKDWPKSPNYEYFRSHPHDDTEDLVVVHENKVDPALQKGLVKSEKISKPKEKRSKRSKRQQHDDFLDNIPSNSDEERSKKIKRSKKDSALSVGDAMVEVQRLRDRQAQRDLEDRRLQFDVTQRQRDQEFGAEQRHRDQQHEAQMAQLKHQTTLQEMNLLHLQLQLEKEKNRTKDSSKSSRPRLSKTARFKQATQAESETDDASEITDLDEI